jgi:hypothetical protein
MGCWGLLSASRNPTLRKPARFPGHRQGDPQLLPAAHVRARQLQRPLRPKETSLSFDPRPSFSGGQAADFRQDRGRRSRENSVGYSVDPMNFLDAVLRAANNLMLYSLLRVWTDACRAGRELDEHRKLSVTEPSRGPAYGLCVESDRWIRMSWGKGSAFLLYEQRCRPRLLSPTGMVACIRGPCRRPRSTSRLHRPDGCSFLRPFFIHLLKKVLRFRPALSRPAEGLPPVAAGPKKIKQSISVT